METKNQGALYLLMGLGKKAGQSLFCTDRRSGVCTDPVAE